MTSNLKKYVLSIPLGLIPCSLLRFNPEQNIKYPIRLRRGFLFIILFITGLITACSTFKDTKVTSSYDSSEHTPAEFSRFKTYQWHPGDRQGNGQKLKPDVEAKISEKIDEVLKSKGYLLSSTAPDFVVNYSVTAKDRVDIRQYNASVYDGFAPGFEWRRDHGLQVSSLHETTQAEIVETREGTLVIDIIHPITNKIIWRGVGRKSLPRKPGPVQRKITINEVVEATLANFPPE